MHRRAINEHPAAERPLAAYVVVGFEPGNQKVIAAKLAKAGRERERVAGAVPIAGVLMVSVQQLPSVLPSTDE